MTIHHDKLAYGKLASMREDFSEDSLIQIVQALSASEASDSKEPIELLDVVDETGKPTGETVERAVAHRQGIRHRTAHVWIVRKKGGKIQILLQKRSKKKSYPDCFDISSAGHIPAGEDYIPSALRELKEELGYEGKAEQLIFCGQRKFEFRDGHNPSFFDNQVSNVYLLWLDKEAEDFVLQGEEVAFVQWFDFEDCMRKVEKNEIPHCIYMEELEMVKAAILTKDGE